MKGLSIQDFLLVAILVFTTMLSSWSINTRLAAISRNAARLVVVQEAQLRELRRGVKTSIDWTIPAVLPKKLAEER